MFMCLLWKSIQDESAMPGMNIASLLRRLRLLQSKKRRLRMIALIIISIDLLAAIALWILRTQSRYMF